MYDIENNMPKFIQRAVHAKKAVIKPSDGISAGVHKVKYSSVYLFACKIARSF